MEVQFQVSEVDAHRLHVGMPVGISVDSIPGRTFQGEITNIPSMAVTLDEDSAIRIFRVTCTLSRTDNGQMKPGMSALGRMVNVRQHVPIERAVFSNRFSILVILGRETNALALGSIGA